MNNRLNRKKDIPLLKNMLSIFGRKIASAFAVTETGKRVVKVAGILFIGTGLAWIFHTKNS